MLMIRPAARTDKLVVEEVDDEVLVYDTERDRAHCLTPLAAAVWRACDGLRTVEDVAAIAGVDVESTRRALHSLDRALLLRERLPKSKPTRRDALVAAAVVPLVMSISAPAAAQAASCLGIGRPCTRTGIPCCPPRTCQPTGIIGFRCR
jgi:hypothetical protein